MNWLFPSFPAVALLAFVGCSSHKPAWVSDQQWSESFHAYRGSKIDGQPISMFLKQRTAVILSGFSAAASKSVDQCLHLEFKPEPNSVLWCGHAAAIDTNGYFLTTAHCLDHPINYLVYSDGQSAGIAIPRIVAKVWDPSKNLDIAIIHVDAKLRDVFTLADADEFHAGDPAIAVGSYEITSLSSKRPNWSLLRAVCFAGQITSVAEPHAGTVFVCSDLPHREGDSGGPLVSKNGTLIGVHSGVGTGWFGKARSVAIRPSHSWLAHIIEQDRQRLAHKPPLTLMPLTSFDNEKVGMVVWLNYEEQ